VLITNVLVFIARINIFCVLNNTFLQFSKKMLIHMYLYTYMIQDF